MHAPSLQIQTPLSPTTLLTPVASSLHPDNPWAAEQEMGRGPGQSNLHTHVPRNKLTITVNSQAKGR